MASAVRSSQTSVAGGRASTRVRGRRRTLDSLDGAREAALRLLEYRARSAHELRRRLSRRGATVAIIEEVLARLAVQGLVDDAAFARQWAESRLRTGHGRRRIAVELQAKGVPGALIRATLESLVDAEAEQAAAERQVRRRLRVWQGVPPDIRRRRLYGLLQRRGFAADVIERALARLVSDDRDD